MTAAGFRAFRCRHNLPQSDLAKALGVSRGLIIDLEKGRTSPSRLLLLALAAYAAGLDPYEVDDMHPEVWPLRIDRATGTGGAKTPL